MITNLVTAVIVYRKESRRLNVLVPDQNIYPQYVKYKDDIFQFHGMTGEKYEHRLYVQVETPEATLNESS